MEASYDPAARTRPRPAARTRARTHVLLSSSDEDFSVRPGEPADHLVHRGVDRRVGRVEHQSQLDARRRGVLRALQRDEQAPERPRTVPCVMKTGTGTSGRYEASAG
eukprot:6189731-Pleurochrysis_carterae.AAC.4